MSIDLHTHTALSDGTLFAEELIEKAIAEGLKVLAITDHNAVHEDLPRLRERYPQIHLPVGCEFSCKYWTASGLEKEIHIVGIDFDPTHEAIQKVLKKNKPNRRPYVEAIIQRLHECGVMICNYEELKARYPYTKHLGRKHIAEELLRMGVVSSINEAFDTYIGAFGERRAFVKNMLECSSYLEVIAAIKAAHGICSLAHLFYYQLGSEDQEQLVKNFKEAAGDAGAMEVLYSAYNEKQWEELKKIALRHSLLFSGASDFHGQSDAEKLGQYPEEFYEKMCQRRREIYSEAMDESC